MLRKSFHTIIKFSLLSCLIAIASFSINAQFKNSSSGEQSLAAPFIQKVKLTASDGASNDIFGQSVAVKGDVAVVGAPQDAGRNRYEGSAYIFTRSGNVWSQQLKLIVDDLNIDSFFGASVAISGDTIVVGAYGNGNAGNGFAGAVYVFVRSGAVWNLQQKLTPSDISPTRPLFGRTVAISGNTIIAGAADADNLKGAAYVFTRSGTVWTQQQKIVTSETNVDRFGSSVAISGETVAIGASGASGTIGAAYVFARSGTTWNLQQKLTASDGQDGDYFGNSIALENNTVVVGSEFSVITNQPERGSAYVFTRSGTTWTQRQKLTASDNSVNDKFGASVAISGSKVVVGAYNANVLNGTENDGAVYIFNLTGSIWNQEQKINLAPELQFPSFGRSVSVDGDTILVGAPGEYGNVGMQQGAAYIFAPQVGNKSFDFDGDGKSDVSVYRPSNGGWYINSSQNGFFGVQFGISTDKIAPADYDGDGKTDIAVYRDGAWYILNSGDNSVRILNFGLAEDIPLPADYDGDGKADINVYRPSNNVFYRLNSTDGQFYYKLFGVSGDKPLIANYDGDGKADMTVFRPSEAKFYWINSTTGGVSSFQHGNSTDVPVSGDFDGDGRTDFAVFRPANSIWYVRNSSNSALVSTYFGTSGDIPSAGDFDGDGKTDVAVFRPSNGTWYILGSTNGYYGYNFGLSTDKPVPAAFNQ